MSLKAAERLLRCGAARCAAVIALLACMGAGPVAGQARQTAIRDGDYDRALSELERELAERPSDTSLRYELARVLMRQGSLEAALAEFDALLARHPADADFLLGRAQTLARLGRDQAALETTERALRVAPDYAEVWELRLKLAERGSDTAAAAALRDEIAARFPEATWWRREPAPREHRRWLTVDVGGDRLSNDAPHWRRESLRLDWRTAGDAALFGAVMTSQRFDRSDSSFAVGGNWQALPEWRIGTALSVTADAEFEPARELTIDAQHPWANGWGTELALKRREYPAAAVTSYSFTGEKYWSDYRIAYRLDYSVLDGGAGSLGHSVVTGWYPSERRNFGLTLGAGEEIETIALDRLLRTRVSSATLTGSETLSTRLALRWWLGTHRQGDFYRRRYAGVAVRVGL